MRKKNVIIFTTIAIFIFLFTFYIFIEWNSPVYPPVRRGVGKAIGTPRKLYDFNTAIEDSDIVAHIMIGDWLGEDDHSTYYEAKIIEQFKGDPVSTIIFWTGGCTKYTFGSQPLFISGNELLVFLKKDTSHEADSTYYWTQVSDHSALYAVIDKNGDAYYIDCDGILTLYSEDIIEPLPHDSFTYELYQKLILEDPELSKCIPYEYIHFYSREDFLTLIP